MSLLYNIPTLLITLLLFATMCGMDWLGFKTRTLKNKKKPSEENAGLGTLEGALLGLLALLLAFTFNLSASRYDARRDVIVEEANDIGTAVLRADLYPDSVRTLYRADFKKYLEARIDYYNAGIDEQKVKKALDDAAAISASIWNRTAALAQDAKNFTRTNQMVPAVNAMIDVVSTRDDKRLMRVPDSILWLLFLLCLAASFIVGYGRKGKTLDWIIVVGFGLMTCMTVYLILDLDRPNRGIITTDDAHAKMMDLRNMMN
ncbi:MAG: hypothetical protein JWP12_205 [Bacteroidetes bacterium]|nr:hypothetical protein [Bacteroidota bacterium]